MKKFFQLFLIFAVLLISSCEVQLPNPLKFDDLKSTQSAQTILSNSKKEHASNTFPLTNSTTSPSNFSSSLTFEGNLLALPQRGIISDSSEYIPGNPKSHSTMPIAHNLSLIIDNTREEDEIYRPVFEEYLKYYYPEYTFQVVNITNFQLAGTTYKKAQAFAAESIDTSMLLFYDGNDILDSFHHDVILRQNRILMFLIVLLRKTSLKSVLMRPLLQVPMLIKKL